MTRRGGPGVQVLALVAVAGLSIYGFYSYHTVSSRLKRSEEKNVNLKQQHDSISAQLQGEPSPMTLNPSSWFKLTFVRSVSHVKFIVN